MKHTQDGFSTVEVILVVIIVALISLAGFVVYKNQHAMTGSETSAGASATDQTAPKQTKDTPSKVTVVTKESLSGMTSNAPLCGSQAAISQSQPSSLDLSYTKPANWSSFIAYANGASFKSLDFKSEQGFKNISTGASLSLAVESICSRGNGLAEDMASYAQNQTNGSTAQLSYIKVAQYYGVRFIHNTGENHNNHDVALLFKDNKMYTIDEQFKYTAANPYPDVITQTLNNIK